MNAVILEPFSKAEFKTWFDAEAHSYAENKVRAGNWPQVGSVERALAELERLLPEREDSPGNLIFAARDASSRARVGSLWLFYKPEPKFPDAYVYDLFVEERWRGQGYGAATLLAGEDVIKRLGARRIGLHVFGFNKAAQGLYQKLGYEVTNLNMAKRL